MISRTIFVLCTVMYALFGDPVFISVGLLSLVLFLVNYMDEVREVEQR